MNMFPGLGIAIVAFTGYVLVDNLMHPASVDKLKEEAARGAHSPTLWGTVAGDKKDKEGAGH